MVRRHVTTGYLYFFWSVPEVSICFWNRNILEKMLEASGIFWNILEALRTFWKKYKSGFIGQEKARKSQKDNLKQFAGPHFGLVIIS